MWLFLFSNWRERTSLDHEPQNPNVVFEVPRKATNFIPKTVTRILKISEARVFPLLVPKVAVVTIKFLIYKLAFIVEGNKLASSRILKTLIF